MNPILAVFMIIVLILCILIMVKKRSDSEGFDERQLLLRGNAYKYAFFSLILFEAFYAVALLLIGHPLMADGVSALLGVFLSITVFAVYCINNDAFKSNRPSFNLKTYSILLAAVTLINGWNGIQSLRSGEMIQNGLLQLSVSALACAVCFLIILIVLLRKAVLDKKEEEA